jgi:hypothetical protein
MASTVPVSRTSRFLGADSIVGEGVAACAVVGVGRLHEESPSTSTTPHQHTAFVIVGSRKLDVGLSEKVDTI